jgi:hypothetical protein
VDDDLSVNARKLIDVAMDEDVPAPVVEDGSWEMVVSRLTIDAAREVAALPVAPRPNHSGFGNWVVFAVVALVVAVAGGLLWLVLQPRPTLPPSAAPTTVPAPAAAHGNRGHAAPVEPPPSPTPTPAIDPATLLDEAENAAPARALELLAQHAELAPMGPDAERRMALRVIALCDLDRVEDARAEAHAFLSDPRDPKWTKRVRSSCAGGTSPSR